MLAQGFHPTTRVVPLGFAFLASLAELTNSSTSSEQTNFARLNKRNGGEGQVQYPTPTLTRDGPNGPSYPPGSGAIPELDYLLSYSSHKICQVFSLQVRLVNSKAMTLSIKRTHHKYHRSNDFNTNTLKSKIFFRQ